MKLTIHSGITITDRCGAELHPLEQVGKAIDLIAKKESATVYSNSPDFIFSIKHLCEKKGINFEFILNGESQGTSIEGIFESFNKSYKLVEEIINKS
jgi:hypothetical protein